MNLHDVKNFLANPVEGLKTYFPKHAHLVDIEWMLEYQHPFDVLVDLNRLKKSW